MFSNSADLPKAKNAEERKRNIEVASKQSSEYNNPCLKVGKQLLLEACSSFQSLNFRNHNDKMNLYIRITFRSKNYHTNASRITITTKRFVQ